MLRKLFFWVYLVAELIKIVVQLIDYAKKMDEKMGEIEDFSNSFNSNKRVDLLTVNETQAEKHIREFRVSNEFMATLESITDMKIDIDIFTKIKTTGREFADQIKKKTSINTKEFSIAVDQLGDGGRDFTNEVKNKNYSQQ